MVAFRTLVSSFLLPIALISQSVQGSGLFDRDVTGPILKDRAVVDGTLCAQADLALGGIDIASDVCICLEAGAITPASLLTLNQQITAKSGILAPIINLLGGITQATAALAENLLPFLLSQPATCNYPANSTPNACGSCDYVCDTGFFECGDLCVATGTTCVSGIVISTKKRALNSGSCPVGFESCRIPSSLRNFECINTASDLESCGGCVVPILGRAQGQDCSAIPDVDSAICQAGRCVIESCARGFTNTGSACIKAESSGRKLSGYWAALEEASHVILQK